MNPCRINSPGLSIPFNFRIARTPGSDISLVSGAKALPTQRSEFLCGGILGLGRTHGAVVVVVDLVVYFLLRQVYHVVDNMKFDSAIARAACLVELSTSLPKRLVGPWF